MSQNIENSDTFGNYLIHGIEEIHLPEMISWWPSTPGWYLVLAALLLWGVRVGRRKLLHWWHNRYRKAAINQLQALRQATNTKQAVSHLPELLKATALQAFPRPTVAGLSGNDWLAFLDDHYAGPSFQQNPGDLLIASAYLPAEQWQCSEDQANTLFDMCQQWIETHSNAQEVA